MNIGDTIKATRQAQGLSRKELAEKADISGLTLANAENGKRTPHAKTLKQIGDALGVDLNAVVAASPPAANPPAATPDPTKACDEDGLVIVLPPQVVQALVDFGKTGLYQGSTPEVVAADILRETVRTMLQGQARYWGRP